MYIYIYRYIIINSKKKKKLKSNITRKERHANKTHYSVDMLHTIFQEKTISKDC